MFLKVSKIHRKSPAPESTFWWRCRSCSTEFCESFRNNFFTEYLWATISDSIYIENLVSENRCRTCRKKKEKKQTDPIGNIGFSLTHIEISLVIKYSRERRLKHIYSNKKEKKMKVSTDFHKIQMLNLLYQTADTYWCKLHCKSNIKQNIFLLPITDLPASKTSTKIIFL